MNINKLRLLFEKCPDKYATAKEIGTTYQTMYNIIYKGSVCKVDMLEKIAKHFQVPVGYFFDEEDSLANNNLYQTGDGNQQNSGDNVQQTMGADKELVSRLVDELSELRKTNQKLTEKLLSQ